MLTKSGKLKKGYKIIFIIVSVFVLIGFAQNAISGSDTIYEIQEIKIEAGNTLWSIAKEYTADGKDVRETVALIKKVNDLDKSTIFPGDILKVPVKID